MGLTEYTILAIVNKVRNERGILSPLHGLIILGALLLLFGGYSAWSFTNTQYIDPSKTKKTEPIIEQPSNHLESSTSGNLTPVSSPLIKDTPLFSELDNYLYKIAVDILKEKKVYLNSSTQFEFKEGTPSASLILPQQASGTILVNNETKDLKISAKKKQNGNNDQLIEIIYLGQPKIIYTKGISSTTKWDLYNTIDRTKYPQLNGIDLEPLAEVINIGLLSYEPLSLKEPKEIFEPTLNKTVKVIEGDLIILKNQFAFAAAYCTDCYIDLSKGEHKIFYYIENDKIIAVTTYVNNALLFYDELKTGQIQSYAMKGSFNIVISRRFNFNPEPQLFDWKLPSPSEISISHP